MKTSYVWFALLLFLLSAPVLVFAQSTPVLNSLAPASAAAGGPSFSLTVTGSNFCGKCVLLWNGSKRPTQIVSSTQATVTIYSTDIVMAGTDKIRMLNPVYWTKSNTLYFTVGNSSFTGQILGDPNVEAQVDSNASGQAEAFPVTALATGTLGSLAVYLDSSSTAAVVSVGLYADASGHPGALLTQSSISQPNPGAWSKVAVSSVNLSQGVRYWIAVLGSGSGTIAFRDANSGACNSETSAQTALSSLPSAWTTGGTWATCPISAFGTPLATAAPIVSVAVTPISSSLKCGNSQQFAAIVSGTSNTSVTWVASGGSISSGGMYSAPMTPGSYVVTATSIADSTKSASASVTVASAVSVSISPSSTSLTTGGTQQFSASVSGTTNTAVTWSATGGSISSSGLYTAPNSTGTYTITATSAADTTKQASASVTVSVPQTVSVSVTPSSSSLLTGGAQQFTATVSGSSNTAVSWSATGGSVSSSGLYTAPSIAGSYSVTAISSADPTKSASATVTVSAPVVSVSISPTSQSLLTSGTQQFIATVSGSINTAVSWSATGGSVSSGGLYTAPDTAGTYTVKATSAADPTKSASASVTVSVPQAVTVSISPPSVFLSTGATQQFTAAVSGSSNAAVTWSATGGSVSSSGLYTAPSMAGSYTVTATSSADSTKSASATVSVTAPVISVTISPTATALLTNGTQQFIASVSGGSNSGVTWSASGGSVSSTGLYTAPNAAGTYTVQATSLADSTKSASATVTVSAAVVSISISPGSASLVTAGTQQFTATVAGSSNTSVTWSATGGSISSGGLYTAPSSAGTYTVRAVSAADSTKSASATVTVSAPVQHSVTLTWSAESGVSGYNVYRGTASGGPYSMLNGALDASANYVDLSVQAGKTYFYVVTSVNGSGVESPYSAQVGAVVPSP